jgi:alpha-1,6-mannosyl-glycoprotein beta-1,2-N-acetylglucosaminyltransferase
VHIGECGTHHKGKNCDPKEKIKNLKNDFDKNLAKYFPENFDIGKINTAIRKVKKSNGGWSDKRDHSLCRSFASPVSARNNLTIFI